MSAELKDFRGKVTPETDVVLEAINRATGKDKSETAREVLHAWAMEQVRLQSVLGQLLRAEGLVGEPEGASGSGRGRSGKSGE